MRRGYKKGKGENKFSPINAHRPRAVHRKHQSLPDRAYATDSIKRKRNAKTSFVLGFCPRVARAKCEIFPEKEKEIPRKILRSFHGRFRIFHGSFSRCSPFKADSHISVPWRFCRQCQFFHFTSVLVTDMGQVQTASLQNRETTFFTTDTAATERICMNPPLVFPAVPDIAMIIPRLSSASRIFKRCLSSRFFKAFHLNWNTVNKSYRLFLIRGKRTSVSRRKLFAF